MKKILLSVLTLTAAMTASALDATFNWAYLIDSSSAQDQTGALLVASDGNLISVSHYGSKATTDNLTYAGEVIANGAEASADNRNIVIIKHTADGKKQWVVTSKQGYFATDYSMIANTPDGGVVAVVKIRASKTASALNQPILVDASNNEITFPDYTTNDWVYNQLVVKISGQGNVEWAYNLQQDQTPLEGKTAAVTDAIYPTSVVADGDGNIYVGGYSSSPTVFVGAGNSQYINVPKNSSSNSLYLVKLDKDGNYVGRVRTSGDNTIEQIASMTYGDGKIYFAGIVKGAADSKLTVGSKSITLENALQGTFAGSIDSNLDVQFLTYIKPFENSSKSHVAQQKSVVYKDGSLYVLGALNGGFGPAESTAATIASTAAKLEGYVVKLDASTGAWSSAHSNGLNIGAYYGAFKANDKYYLFGYQMNATTGVFVEEYASDSSWELGERTSLIAGGGSPTTATAPAFDSASGKLYVSGRGNNKFTFAKSEETLTPTGYGSVLASYTLGSATGVSNVAAEGLSFKAVEGAIVVTASQPTDVALYNAQGQAVYSAKVEAGETVVPLAAGVYVAKDNKLIVR